MTYKEQRIVPEYRENAQPWPATTPEMGVWAIETQGWQPQRSAMLKEVC